MRPLQTDLSIYNKFDFEKPPVGVKFLFSKPEGIERLDKSLGFCEMLKEAHQRGTTFYFDKDNEDCVGKMPLGMMDVVPVLEGGQLGPELEIYQEPRANSRIYQHIPMFARGTVNYVVFSPLEELTFDPDLLVLYATPRQAEIVLRAMSYSTGEMWEPKAMPVVACAWIYVYPYKSGKVNYMVTGMSYGMIAREVFPEGRILISIPWNWIPTITQNLQEMKWVLPTYTGRERYIAEMNRLKSEIALKL
ncbi:MAG: DUF169 domain-containing protein [Dehalococcoidia bacterium]|nr:DUF169 domain-containing protein [Dehalococcoidia bacterium]